MDSIHLETNRPPSEMMEDQKAPPVNDIVEKYGQTKRLLKPRHVHLMAIGSSIGVGLWVGIGVMLKQSGPLSLILGYAFYGCLFILPCLWCVAEMCAYLPVKGSIYELASRYVDPAVGFTLGWIYFFASTMFICVEYSAIATIMQYWDADTNGAAWVAMGLGSCTLLNLIGVRYYGEAEFVMASTKVILLFMLVMITIVTMAGGNPKGEAYGFSNWGDGAMHPYHSTGATGKFLGIWSVVIYAGFTIGGPDILALSAGEIQNPRRTIPRVAKFCFYRVVGFYVLGTVCVGIICGSRDAQLIRAIDDGEPGAGASPWVIGIQNLGITGLPHFINALILLSGWSCGNAFLYSASRTLYGLARDGQAPRYLLKCTKTGIPYWCVLTVSLISCVSFLVASNDSVTVLLWFVDLSATGLITSFTLMVLTFLCWYRARKAQGLTNDMLPYVAPLAPWAPMLAFVIGCVTLIFVGFDVFEPFDVRGFFVSYFPLMFSAVMFIIGKIKYTREGRGWVNPKEADLFSGKAEIDAECRIWEDGGILENEKARLAEMNIVRRCWERIW